MNDDDPTTPQPTDEFDDDPRVAEALSIYLHEMERGKTPNRREFVSRYPEIAHELHRCLDGLAFVHAAAGEIPGAPPPPKRRPDIDPATAQPLGDFQLVQEIGYGGMGTVYEAIQLSLGRRVAVKVLPMAAALDTRHLERFHNEAQAAARLHHSNIVPVYAVGCERSVHFYAMQLIDGSSLADVIRDLRRIAAKDGAAKDLLEIEAATRSLSVARGKGVTAYARSVATIGLQAAEALDYAHTSGIVHRDIKPANLLLDTDGKLWITDFGLAQFYTETNLTRTGDFVGTLRYMSPEQASGRAVVLDQRTDIYSLGVTLYELLTLQRALKGETHAELLREISQDEPPSPRSIDSTIAPELDTIISKAISKDPADRYVTAGAFADDLRRFLRDEPIHARPPTIKDKAIKWVRRHRALAATVFCMLILATLGFSVSTALIAHAQMNTRIAYELQKQKTAEADQQRDRAERLGRQARQAVEFFSQIASDEMDRPEMTDVRREMLEESLSYYQNLLEDRSSPSVGAELDAARAHTAAMLQTYSALDEMLRANTRVRYLSEQSVRDDLGVTQTQVSSLLSQANDFPHRGGGGGEPPELRQLSSDEKLKQFTARAKQINDSIEATLGPVKAERLRQIQRQLRGPLAVSDADVAQKLDLTHDQREKVRQIQTQYHEKRMNPGSWQHEQGSGEDPKASSVASITQLFSSEQLQSWNTLIGKPFAESVSIGGPDDGPPMGRGGGGFGHDHGMGHGPGGPNGGGGGGGPQGPMD